MHLFGTVSFAIYWVEQSFRWEQMGLSGGPLGSNVACSSVSLLLSLVSFYIDLKKRFLDTKVIVVSNYLVDRAQLSCYIDRCRYWDF